jgi:hypothetical protein
MICKLMDHRERAKDAQPAGQESIVILIDYRGTTMRTNPSISVARKVGIFPTSPSSPPSTKVLSFRFWRFFKTTMSRPWVVGLSSSFRRYSTSSTRVSAHFWILSLETRSASTPTSLISSREISSGLALAATTHMNSSLIAIGVNS